MYVTIKLDDKGYKIHSISDGDKEIVTEGDYFVMPWNMVNTRCGANMTLKEAAELIKKREEEREEERRLVSKFENEHRDEINEILGLRTFIGVEIAALTSRMKQCSTSYSSHIFLGKRFYNDFFFNHHTIALVNNCLKLLSCVVIEAALDLMKRINYLNSLLSTRKRTILRSSHTVFNAMIAMHVHRQFIILLLGIREKVNTGELFSLL